MQILLRPVLRLGGEPLLCECCSLAPIGSYCEAKAHVSIPSTNYHRSYSQSNNQLCDLRTIYVELLLLQPSHSGTFGLGVA
jgi:hypothetical protein